MPFLSSNAGRRFAPYTLIVNQCPVCLAIEADRSFTVCNGGLNSLNQARHAPTPTVGFTYSLAGRSLA